MHLQNHTICEAIQYQRSLSSSSETIKASRAAGWDVSDSTLSPNSRDSYPENLTPELDPFGLYFDLVSQTFKACLSPNSQTPEGLWEMGITQPFSKQIQNLLN